MRIVANRLGRSLVSVDGDAPSEEYGMDARTFPLPVPVPPVAAEAVPPSALGEPGEDPVRAAAVLALLLQRAA